jgi:hypothetical protein
MLNCLYPLSILLMGESVELSVIRTAQNASALDAIRRVVILLMGSTAVAYKSEGVTGPFLHFACVPLTP